MQKGHKTVQEYFANTHVSYFDLEASGAIFFFYDTWFKAGNTNIYSFTKIGILDIAAAITSDWVILWLWAASTVSMLCIW